MTTEQAPIPLFRFPQQVWDVPRADGSVFQVEGMIPELPTNLLVKGFQVKQLPEGAYSSLEGFFEEGKLPLLVDLYSLPKESLVDDFLVIPSSDETQSLFFVCSYGFVRVSSTTIGRNASILLRKRLNYKRRYLFYLMKDNLLALVE